MTRTSRTDPIEVKAHPVLGGIIRLYRFDNGYGASVITNEYSYGGNKGLWELAVVKFNKKGDHRIVYNTPITSDVIGHLSLKEVEQILLKIQLLEP